MANQSYVPYRAVYFDWGGVVAPDPGDDFLYELVKSVGATESQIKEILDRHMVSFMCGTIKEEEFWQKLRDDYGLKIPISISDRFMEWRGLEVDQRVVSLVRRLKEQGIDVAVLSNVIEPTYKAIERAGYYKLFDAVIASCRVGHVKPQPKIYEIALRELHRRPEEALFIDDKPAYLDEADRLGFTTILAQTSAQIVRDVERCTWLV